MTRFYDIDEANATVLELEAIVTVLAEQRADAQRGLIRVFFEFAFQALAENVAG